MACVIDCVWHYKFRKCNFKGYLDNLIDYTHGDLLMTQDRQGLLEIGYWWNSHSKLFIGLSS